MFSARLNRIYNAVVNSGNVRYATYPAIANIDVAGVKLTSKTAKKMDATAAAILTAGTSPQVEYWICSVLLHSASAAEIHGAHFRDDC